MADNNFFDKQNEAEEVEKVKLGDTEFTTEELNALVESGKRLQDIETKQGQPLDKILSSWGERGERIGEYKKQVEELSSKLEKLENPPAQEQIDKEKLKEQVINEAREFGLVTKDEALKMMEELYETRRYGERIFSKVNKIVKTAKSEGKPTTSAEELLKFMSDPSNPKDPEKAYKVMFEKELENWKEEQLKKIKQPNMVIENKSTAGGKELQALKLDSREDLRNALRVAIRGEGGQ